ncbi:MAG TPA: exopolysaccharide biosynthesis polyprenyl glycosylphosphotransferase [Azospirillum sp.]|nr:exopolysaccharide biosynthesis polyprenyl glycosylphosphotransferase [Azospirillum sp.]
MPDAYGSVSSAAPAAVLATPVAIPPAAPPDVADRDAAWRTPVWREGLLILLSGVVTLPFALPATSHSLAFTFEFSAAYAVALLGALFTANALHRLRRSRMAKRGFILARALAMMATVLPACLVLAAAMAPILAHDVNIAFAWGGTWGVLALGLIAGSRTLETRFVADAPAGVRAGAARRRRTAAMSACVATPEALGTVAGGMVAGRAMAGPGAAAAPGREQTLLTAAGNLVEADPARAAELAIAGLDLDRVDTVDILATERESDFVLHLVRRLEVHPVQIALVTHEPALVTRVWREAPPLMRIIIVPRPMGRADAMMKRTLDVVVASLCLALLSPVMLAVAALIKLDTPGPVFFRQDRVGYRNRIFRIYKFRTMHDGAADPLADRLTERNDPRVTRFGAFLRRSSIDELPQLINVLLGDMSLVGPRPHPLNAKAGQALYAEVVDRYATRHRVTPGITGWAQVHGWRGNTDDEEKLIRRWEHDMFYIENWSIWLDIQILLVTPVVLLTGKNAY